MEGSPETSANRLHRIWLQVGIVAGFVASIVTIIGFFGIHPPSGANKPNPPVDRPKNEESQPKKTGFAAGVTESDRKPGQIGTFHIDGGFDLGDPMISRDALSASDSASAVTLLRPNGKEESLSDTKVVLATETNQSVHLWRKGKQFVHGIKLTSDSPHLVLKGEGMADVTIPTDADGRLQVNVVWPVNKSFTSVEYAGPIEVGGLSLDGGLSIGQPEPLELANVLPSHFSLNVPKPGEVLSEFKGELRYEGSTDERRFIVIQAFASSDQPVTVWSSEFNHFGPTIVRRTKGGVFDRGFTSLKVWYSKDAE